MNTSQCQNFNLETHPEYLMSLNQSVQYYLLLGIQNFIFNIFDKKLNALSMLYGIH